MSSKEQTLVACGDILIECDSDAETISKMWDGVRDEIQDATVALGHGELPFSERGYKTYVDMFVGAPKACPPHNVKTIKEAGFDALSARITSLIWGLTQLKTRLPYVRRMSLLIRALA